MPRLNGPQNTGRDYRNLSEPQYHTRRDHNVAIAMRDGTTLMADVHRPDVSNRGRHRRSTANWRYVPTVCWPTMKVSRAAGTTWCSAPA
jgi:predicted acyl esterase